MGFDCASYDLVGGVVGAIPVFGRQGFAREGMQGLIIEKGFCATGFGRKGRQGLLKVGIHGTAAGGEGGETETGLGYTNIEPCKEIGPLAGIGLGRVCFGLSFRAVFMKGGYGRGGNGTQEDITCGLLITCGHTGGRYH